MARDFRNIRAWQFADDLTVLVYSKTKKFPKEELYGVTSQIRRAAVSVPTNIAEGASREHKREYLHFLYVARGSLSETEYLLHLSRRLEYFDDADYHELNKLREDTGKLLHGLIRSVKSETKLLSRIIAFLTSSLVLGISLKVVGHVS